MIISKKISSTKLRKDDELAKENTNERQNKKFLFKINEDFHEDYKEDKIDSKLILKNFFDAVSNNNDNEKANKLSSLTKMISSVSELEKDGILNDKEASILVEFVVGKFVESRLDKALESLKINNNFNLFIASSKKDFYK